LQKNISTFSGEIYKVARDHEKNIRHQRTKEEMAEYISNVKRKPETVEAHIYRTRPPDFK
jgi:hypothetical protein